MFSWTGAFAATLSLVLSFSPVSKAQTAEQLSKQQSEKRIADLMKNEADSEKQRAELSRQLSVPSPTPTTLKPRSKIDDVINKYGICTHTQFGKVVDTVKKDGRPQSVCSFSIRCETEERRPTFYHGQCYADVCAKPEDSATLCLIHARGSIEKGERRVDAQPVGAPSRAKKPGVR